MIKVKVPGKLFIAGEYAVVEPGYPAILVTVNRYLEVMIKKAKHYGSIISEKYSQIPVKWYRKGEKIIVLDNYWLLRNVLNVIEVVEKYISEQGKKRINFHLKIVSHLDSQTGEKYGLGSSAAVLVAVTRALLRFYQIKENDEIVFKLASLSQISYNINSSYGDIAACTYKGWISYTSFDRLWVQKLYLNYSVTDVIKMKWPYLFIERLTIPPNLRLIIGWTKEVARTRVLVKEVIQTKNEEYLAFLEASKVCVEKLIYAFKTQNVDEILNQIRINRKLLISLNKIIETPKLKLLCDIAENYHGASKLSGAGGGDCGIVLIDKKYSPIPIIKKWQEKGILYLPFKEVK